jgi:hypothetical protein
MNALLADPEWRTWERASLDLHKGISTSTVQGCPRWPEHLRLRASNGDLVRGRCRATNQCDYCARLAAVETAEVLAIDALEGTAPVLWAVLTTPRASIDPSDFWRAREFVVRALRRVWGCVEYAALVEFTTGYGPRSGGRRRPHWNLLLKGVDADDQAEVLDVVDRQWCSRVGGHRDAQHVGTVDEIGGLMRYLALHFQKASQAPPKGWRGHRFMHSRGYLSERTPALRRRAREQLQLRRELWKVRRDADRAGVELVDGEAFDLAELAWEVGRAQTWELVQVHEQVSRPRPARRVGAAGSVRRPPR